VADAVTRRKLLGAAATILGRARRRRLLSAAALTVAVPVGSIVISLLLISLLLLYIRASPLTAYLALLNGGLGSTYAVGVTVIRSVPLILAGMAVAIAFRAGLFNIGGEGQLQMGALLGVIVALKTGSLWLALGLGAAAGAALGAFAGALKATRGVNEIITTIMLNFVAIELVNHVVGGPFVEQDAPYPATPAVPLEARLPVIVPGTRIHIGFLLSVAIAVALHFVLTRTVLGFRLRAVGANPDAARHAGIHPGLYVVVAMAISGAAAGLGGIIEVLGVQYRLGHDWSSGWGFQGIAVAFLAGGHPIGVVLVGLFFGLLVAGSTNMQAVSGVPASVVWLIQSIPVLLLIAFIAWRERRRPAAEADT
jgi:simple sugar transport system permease protein